MTSMDVTERILRNDPDLQHLYLSSDSITNAQDVARSLTLAAAAANNNNNINRNTHLQHVYFRNFKLGGGAGGRRGDGDNDVDVDDLTLLLHSTSYLSNLQSLFFHCTEVPVVILTQLLLIVQENNNNSNNNNNRKNNHKQQLTSLGLRYCKFKYKNEEEWDQFEIALRQNTSLQDVCIECCEWWQVEEQQHHHHPDDHRLYNLSKMSSFLEAISRIPTLRNVECVAAPVVRGPVTTTTTTTTTAVGGRGAWQQQQQRRRRPHRTAAGTTITTTTRIAAGSGGGGQQQQQQRLFHSTLDGLCRIPFLQTLRLRNVSLPESDVDLLCNSLVTTPRTTIRKLILSLDMGPTSALALSKLLLLQQQQQQQKEEEKGGEEEEECPQSQQLSSSTSSLVGCLEHLAIRIDNLIDNDSPRLLAWALRQSSLQHFHLSGEEAKYISEESKKSFRDMMQTNIRLEFVRLDVNDYELQSELAFYLQLNHKGRRTLFQRLQQQQQQQKLKKTTAARAVKASMNDASSSSSSSSALTSPPPPCFWTDGNRGGVVNDKNDEESSLWVQALSQNATDLRALHYFINLHPSLFASAALRKEEEEGTRQHYKQQQQQQRDRALLYEWDAEDGIVYDSDGW